MVIHIHPSYPAYCGLYVNGDTHSTNSGHVDCVVCNNNLIAPENPPLPDRTKLVHDHAKAMLNTLELPKNAQKGTWVGIPQDKLLEFLDGEIEEFHAALWDFTHHGGPVDRVESEASDCSNILAFIVDNCKRNKIVHKCE